MTEITRTILLAGSPRGDDVGARCGVSMLDLPVEASGRTLLDAWIDALSASRVGAGSHELVICSPKASPRPGRFRPLSPGVRFQRDRDDVRGTGGATLDALEHAEGEEWVLVAEASRLPVPDIEELFRAGAHHAGSASVLLGVHSDRSLAGVALARVEALRRGRRAQFSDLKEQIMPELIALGEVVRAVELPRVSRSIRTRSGYLAALRDAIGWTPDAGDGVHARVLERGVRDSIVCAGARVETGATVHASVVMPGASVGENSVVVSCVLGPSAIVKPSEKLLEREASGQ